MVADYLTTEELRQYLGDPSQGSQDDPAMKSAIGAASRQVEGYCGRHFYQTTEVQYFSPNPGKLWILNLDDMDLATTSGLVVQTEFDNSGSYGTTWTLNTDFICEPVNQSSNGIDGWPYTYLRALGPKVWPWQPIDFYRDTVKITATWGWVEVPVPVKQATALLAAMYFKLGGAPFGIAGFGDFAAVKVRDIPQVCALLKPYRKFTALMMA